ncbi:hypothetical protein R3P38DRAFT_1215233 [Favolaschia claudopus]|uniref:Uncharacterized protein n=1 Tax=Favolaschia claudopus TaxID=2862362 RepID=A0AAW0B4H1_9AGAR
MFPNPHSPSILPPSYRDAMYVPSRDAIEADVKAKPYRPLLLRNWFVTLVAITLFGLAIAIEVCLAISKRNGGFPTPERNVFTGVSPRFLTAFFPTLLVAVLLLIWQSSDRSYRELQPYIVLARGNVTAAEGLLANYSGLSAWGVITNALKFRHYLILISTLTTLLGSFLQPLAGSIIQVTQLPKTSGGSTKTIGLVSDVLDLNAFLAAAGYAEAAVFHGLSDPPFIHGAWSIAEFEVISNLNFLVNNSHRQQFPDTSVLNGTLSVNTTAIQTLANCQAPQATELLSVPGTPNFTIQALNSAGCVGSTTFNPESTSSSTQYGAAAVQNCGETDVQFQPIMFWFFHIRQINESFAEPQGAAVFCKPSIKAFNVMTTTDVNNGLIVGIVPFDDVTTSNNVTGSPQNGRAFNSVRFPLTNDSFVQARAVSISAGVSGAIFRFAAQQAGGIQSTFDDNGFLAITQKVFTQHLSISSKSIYFVDGRSTVPASLVSLVPRLTLDELPAHALTAVLVLIGLSASFLHIMHSRQRRGFFLAASPGSIAHIVSMTTHAKFGEKLYPYDDDQTLARKLAGLSFSLDPRTGAVVADRDVGPTAEGTVTPFNVTFPSPPPRVPAEHLVASYSAQDKEPISRSSSPVDEDNPRALREKASTSTLGLSELADGEQLPSYVDEPGEGGGVEAIMPLQIEKRGKTRASQAESLPLLAGRS